MLIAAPESGTKPVAGRCGECCPAGESGRAQWAWGSRARPGTAPSGLPLPRFRGSLDLQLWTRIGAMNLAGAPDSDPARRKGIFIEPHRSAALRFKERGARVYGEQLSE